MKAWKAKVAHLESQRSRFASAIVQRMPERGGRDGMWASCVAFRRVRERYVIPRADLDLWYTGRRLT